MNDDNRITVPVFLTGTAMTSDYDMSSFTAGAIFASAVWAMRVEEFPFTMRVSGDMVEMMLNAAKWREIERGEMADTEISVEVEELDEQELRDLNLVDVTFSETPRRGAGEA